MLKSCKAVLKIQAQKLMNKRCHVERLECKNVDRQQRFSESSVERQTSKHESSASTQQETLSDTQTQGRRPGFLNRVPQPPLRAVTLQNLIDEQGTTSAESLEVGHKT